MRRTTLIRLAPIIVAAAVAVGAGDRPAAARSAPAIAPGVCVYTPDGSNQDNTKSVGLPPANLPNGKGGVPVATLRTNLGTITIKLDEEKAPCAVNSFRFLASKGFFDRTVCHRMLDAPDAGVLQCGDPTGTGRGGPGYEFADENLGGAPGYSRGEVAMANAGPDTNGSQFFLVFKLSTIRRDYTPFGSILEGVEVLDKAAKAGTTGPQHDRPRTKVTLRKVTVSDQ
jgi:peptidyl-prolyl cis-trans isomerase B (cyclophilin B)